MFLSGPALQSGPESVNIKIIFPFIFIFQTTRPPVVGLGSFSIFKGRKAFALAAFRPLHPGFALAQHFGTVGIVCVIIYTTEKVRTHMYKYFYEFL